MKERKTGTLLALLIVAFMFGCNSNPVVTPPRATRTGTNVKNIAFYNGKAFITQHQSPFLLVVRTSDGSVTDSVDISRFNTFAGTPDEEPYPYMDPIAVNGTDVYVACQRLAVDSSSGFPLPADTSFIVVVSGNDHTIKDSIALRFKNPTAVSVIEQSDQLLVTSTGNYFDYSDGAVEVIDLRTNRKTSYIPESRFGGDVDKVLAISPTQAYATVSAMVGQNYTTTLVQFDPSSRLITDTITTVDNAFPGMVHDENYLYVGDQSASSPGVIVLDWKNGNTKVAGPLSTGYPPSSLALMGTTLLAGTSPNYSEGNITIITTTDHAVTETNVFSEALRGDFGVYSDGTHGYIIQRGAGKDAPNTLIKVSAQSLLQGDVLYESTLASW